MNQTENNTDNHVCPWWMGYLLANPVRKLGHNPNKLLKDYIKPGMNVIDIGSAMGFFTLPMANLVGKNGSVIAIDVQEKMLSTLKKKADKSDYSNNIDCRLASSASLNISDQIGQIDFALAFYVIHEIPNQKNVFEQVFKSLKKGAKLLVSEPKGHVSLEKMSETIDHALAAGFKIISHPDIGRSHSVVFEKPGKAKLGNSFLFFF
ncbi:MAG: class I SAM-dependent methyltransferase [Saprospiraceae bacterium]|nr:class I SAM-dependent methyltransferase [Saprospiraceae bacterium]